MSLLCAVCSQPIDPETTHVEIDVTYTFPESSDDETAFFMHELCALNTIDNWDRSY